MMKLWSQLASLISRFGAAGPAGIFGALVLATHGKESANALIIPFQDCHSITEILCKFWNFTVLEWFGWWGTAVMLLLAIAGLLSVLTKGDGDPK